jgi:hypothetical protein
MIRHCVSFRFVDGTTDDAIAAFATALGELPDQIDTIRGYSFGRDLGLRDTNAQFAVVADFDDEDGWRTYAEHPAHLEVIRTHAEPIIAERSAVQFRC